MSLNRYITLISLIGLTILVATLATSSLAAIVPSSFEIWFFALALVIGECIPMRLVHHGSEGEITTSSTFALALLLTAGAPATMLAMTTAAVVADGRQHKSSSRTLFNVGQYAIVVAAAGLTLEAVSGFDATRREFAPSDLVAACAAAGVFFVVNAVLVARAVSLADGAAFWRYLRTDLELQTSTVGILLGLGPIVVIAADFSLAALPLLGLPLIALLRSGRRAVDHQREALHDSLTGLPNRMLLGDRIEQALVLSRRNGAMTAVMLMDLDRFKDINDTLGHQQGDRVLQAVADRLRASVRECDTVARLGGDEFAIVLPESSADVACAVARKVCAAIEEPFVTADGLELRVCGSIGVALAPRDGEDTETLVRRADAAMYRAKAAGGGETLYAPEIDDAPPERLLMVAELRSALERRELVMHFQPKISLKSGRIEGLEALVRWPHPRLGLLYPDRFLELSERAGLMGQLTSFAIDAALQECRSWLAAGLEVKVAVNLSPESLRDDSIVGEVQQLLAERAVPGRLLQLEITENCLVADPETARRVLAQLRELDVGIAIDDFGTGYSSLAHIKDLPVDEIKIDRSFVSGLENGSTEAAIVRSTIQLAHDLGLRVVAEGVETSDVLGRLAGFGCDAVQGFLLGRPVPGDELWPALTAPGSGSVPVAA